MGRTTPEADLARSRARRRRLAIAGWLLLLLAVACGAGNWEQLDTLVVHGSLHVSADDHGSPGVTATASRIVLADAAGHRLVLTPTGAQALDASGHVVGTLALVTAPAPAKSAH